MILAKVMILIRWHFWVWRLGADLDDCESRRVHEEWRLSKVLVVGWICRDGFQRNDFGVFVSVFLLTSYCNVGACVAGESSAKVW